MARKNKYFCYSINFNSIKAQINTMANINIENISDLDLNGHNLFQDSESFITELNEEEECIVGGYDFGGKFCGISDNFCGISDNFCGVTGCLNTIGLCGNTATCFNTIGG